MLVVDGTGVSPKLAFLDEKCQSPVAIASLTARARRSGSDVDALPDWHYVDLPSAAEMAYRGTQPITLTLKQEGTDEADNDEAALDSALVHERSAMTSPHSLPLPPCPSASRRASPAPSRMSLHSARERHEPSCSRRLHCTREDHSPREGGEWNAGREAESGGGFARKHTTPETSRRARRSGSGSGVHTGGLSGRFRRELAHHICLAVRHRWSNRATPLPLVKAGSGMRDEKQRRNERYHSPPALDAVRVAGHGSRKREERRREGNQKCTDGGWLARSPAPSSTTHEAAPRLNSPLALGRGPAIVDVPPMARLCLCHQHPPSSLSPGCPAVPYKSCATGRAARWRLTQLLVSGPQDKMERERMPKAKRGVARARRAAPPQFPLEAYAWMSLQHHITDSTPHPSCPFHYRRDLSATLIPRRTTSSSWRLRREYAWSRRAHPQTPLHHPERPPWCKARSGRRRLTSTTRFRRGCTRAPRTLYRRGSVSMAFLPPRYPARGRHPIVSLMHAVHTRLTTPTLDSVIFGSTRFIYRLACCTIRHIRIVIFAELSDNDVGYYLFFATMLAVTSLRLIPSDSFAGDAQFPPPSPCALVHGLWVPRGSFSSLFPGTAPHLYREDCARLCLYATTRTTRITAGEELRRSLLINLDLNCSAPS
ncbi:hypothetical protein B0H19DRAFT_1224432 [Mycena capillaripes]|nr:hypothetical protein B0H19DRAFT_1224432 [Mycena capillaripes]